MVSLGNERFIVPEALFQPSLLGIESAGIHEAIVTSIAMCDPSIHQDLFCNVVLSGGNTNFRGLAQRLTTEIARLAPPAMKVHVVAPNCRSCSAWLGGSIFTVHENFRHIFVQAEEYKEWGPSIVRRKCF